MPAEPQPAEKARWHIYKANMETFDSDSARPTKPYTFYHHLEKAMEAREKQKEQHNQD